MDLGIFLSFLGADKLGEKDRSQLMNSKLLKILLFLTLAGIVSPLRAEHGLLSSNSREAWINLSVNDLVATGWVAAPAKPVKDMTNLEVAQLTAKASETLLAQADLGLPPALPSNDMPLPEPTLPSPAAALPSPLAPGAKSMSQLVEEFRQEL